MQRTYNPAIKATVTVDDSGRVRGINHLDEYRDMAPLRGREAAQAYVREMAETFSIAPEALRQIEQPVSYLDPRTAGVEYRFSEEKSSFDGTTYSYYQTYLNTPVWESGVTTTLKQAPTRVVSAINTSAADINASLPSAQAIERYRRLIATGEKGAGGSQRPAAKRAQPSDTSGTDLLAALLGHAMKPAKRKETGQTAPHLIRGRFFIYRYQASQRATAAPPTPAAPPTHVPNHMPPQPAAQPLCGMPPTLPLPPVDKSIQDGHWYVVAELIVRLPYEGSRMNWRLLVDVETNTILYLRALTSGINGFVFTYDPITSTGTTTHTPDQSNADLNPHRNTVVLPNLNAPVGGTQSLQGSLVTLTEIEPLTVAPPTRPGGSDFNVWDVRTNEFAAVNAYYHNDRFFQLIANLGFPLATYFDGTAFPVEVDHRGKGTVANQGNTINAHCIGDGDGIDHACYALADLTDTTHPIGIALDWRVILHELGGHGTLHDHVGGPNFGFAHSAGDSFAIILNDYLSEWHNGAALDRFLLAPFVPAVPRRSDRTVAAGWGWGGVNDTGISATNPGYDSEQILSTTMFRAYRSIGGDSTAVTRREFAARCMAYLMLRAIGTMTSASLGVGGTAATPAGFLSALIAADALNWTSEGAYGGAYNKVLTWSFEKQNLNGGAKPAVDVYIDDGRAGEYEYLPVHWVTTTIWNRRNSDSGTSHEEPALDETNYAYVKIKNRGTSIANNVIVKAYHCKPSAGVLWPNDLQPMTTAQLSAGTLQPNDTEEKTVGPFEWTPVTNAWGHDCMLMIVSATGDPSNVDNFTAGEVVEDWRLVPNDNNVGQRNVTLVPGGSLDGLMAGLHGKGFWVGNPGRTAATITATITLPPLLARRGWRVTLHGLPENGLRLKSREQRLVTCDVLQGSPFTKAEASATTERDIVITAMADGAITGGMVYRIDPEIDWPYNDRTPGEQKEGCCDKAKRLLECLDLPGGKVKRVRVRKVAIDVEMGEDDCCCD